MVPYQTTFVVLVILVLFPQEGSSSLVDSTCKQTPNYQTCVSILKADPKSSSAQDVTSLALILVSSLKSKSSSALQAINHQLMFLKKRTGTNPRLKLALNQCLKNYNFILRYDVTEAVEALTKGDPKFAEDATRDAASVAQECEDGFKPFSSPISNLNKAAHDIADVATSLVRLLL